VKGNRDFYGNDKIDILLVNDSKGLDDADQYIRSYRMGEFSRVAFLADVAAENPMWQLGQHGWGYVVIDADGNLQGIDVRADRLGSLLAESTGISAATSVKAEFASSLIEATDITKIQDFIPETVKTRLTVTLELQEGWHVYGPEENNPTPTVVKVAYDSRFKIGEAQLPKASPAAGGKTTINGPVEITFDVEIPKGTPIGHHLVHGTIKFMTCNKEKCRRPQTVRWKADVMLE